MKNYRLIYESPSHYVLHDLADRKDFHVAKRGLDDATHEKIKNLPSMNGTDTTPLKDQPQDIQTLADGGMAGAFKEDTKEQENTPERQHYRELMNGETSEQRNQRLEKEQNTPAEIPVVQTLAAGGPVQHFDSGTPDVQPMSVNISDADLAPTVNKAAPVFAVPAKPANDISDQIDAAIAAKHPDERSTLAALANLGGNSVPDAPAQPATAPVVSPSDQISLTAAPKQKAAGIPNSNPAGQFSAGEAQEARGIQGVANAQSDAMQQSAAATQDFIDKEKQLQDTYAVNDAASTKHLQELEKGASSGALDPNRYWANKGTGGQIAASLGLIFGGIGAGLTHQPNAALEVIQKGIDNDIRAQMEDKSNAMNLYKVGLEKYRDSRSAQEFATLQAHALLAGQLQQIAQKTGAPQAQAAAQQMIGTLRKNDAETKQKLDMQAAQMALLNQAPSQSGGVDTNRLRAMTATGLIPKEEVPAAMKEFGEYQVLGNHVASADKLFADASKDATYTERLANAIPGGGLLPTVRPSTKNYEAETGLFLDKLTRDTSGRVTPEAIKLISKSLPVAGDTPAVLERKRNTVKDALKAGFSFPNLQTYGLLNPNDPVVQSSAGRAKRFTPGAPVK